METVEKTREEIFSEHTFEWIKTERSGELCYFSKFEVDNGTEYTTFTDNTRIRTDLIGDIVLMHKYGAEILGNELAMAAMPPPAIEPKKETVLDTVRVEVQPAPSPVKKETVSQDPVVSILEKTKKKTEKIVLTLTVKIPSPDLYSVIRENFDNVDEILLGNIMEQIQESALREAVKRELQTIYTKKKKA